MTNGQIYQKTLTFSLRRFLIDVLSLIVMAVLTVGGFFLADKLASAGLIGLLIGLVAGIIAAALIVRFLSYRYKAAQIAMMTKAITEGALPDNVREEGLRAVRERFATVAIYFAVTGAVKSVFRQLGKLVTGVASSIGGERGGQVGNAISAVIQTLVAYLCDCCLGWIFYRAGKSAFKAACEGAVLFFRHGKTFLKNMGRIFGMGLASLLVIGGAFTGVFFLIFNRFSGWFDMLSAEMATLDFDNEAVSEIVSNPTMLTVATAAILAIILWKILHSVLVRPFILVGVLRNYIASGIDDIPTESSFSELAAKSRQFARLQEKASAAGA